ncbi:profilin [Panaeolus papilionaceus]|nr:profilin [Panaeolus papilionaceus]
MSWQTYVDSNLLGTGKVAKAAIIGLQGGVWAHSPDFNISTAEQQAIIKGYSAPDTLQASGVRLGGEKYFTLSVLDRTIQGKKGPDGAVIVKTKQAVIIATYVAPVQSPELTPIVESLADYLINVGY